MNSLETQVLQLIGEDPSSPDVFSEGSDDFQQIRDSINDAIEEIVSITGGNKKKYFIPIDDGKGFYRLKISNGSFGWVADAIDVDNNRRLVQTDIVALSIRNPHWMQSTGPADEYLQIGHDIIGFFPRPSSGVIELTIVQIPDRYTLDSDRIHVREQFKKAVVYYAVSEYWASRGDATESIKEFTNYINMMGLDDSLPKAQEYVPRLKS